MKWSSNGRAVSTGMWRVLYLVMTLGLLAARITFPHWVPRWVSLLWNRQKMRTRLFRDLRRTSLNLLSPVLLSCTMGVLMFGLGQMYLVANRASPPYRMLVPDVDILVLLSLTYPLWWNVLHVASALLGTVIARLTMAWCGRLGSPLWVSTAR